LAANVEMETIARRAAGEPSAQRRRSAFEIRARAAYTVRVNDDASVSIGDVLAVHRRHDRLIVDASIRHQDAERLKRCDGAMFEFQHPRLLLEPLRCGEVRTARVCDRGDSHAPLLGRQAHPSFQPFHARDPEGFGVGHDVGLAHRHEVLGAEIASDQDLMFNCPLP
jgi:hypothetical protein